ncbi:unnamed protein product, partial [Chrysoparadoxa australica]
GYRSRVAERQRLRKRFAATVIQSGVRGCRERRRYKTTKEQHRRSVAQSCMTRWWRGCKGRVRAGERRVMLLAARSALDAVGVGKLLPRDITDLGDAIHCALMDPAVPLPAPGVLGLVRLVLLMLALEGQDQEITFFTALGTKVCCSVRPETLTWAMASRVLCRPMVLLRKLRACVSGLVQGSPKLLHLSQK